MSKTRAQAPRITLPPPKAFYNQRAEELRSKILEDHLATLQPLQQRQTVTGAKGGNAALASLITALANLGFITDSTT